MRLKQFSLACLSHFSYLVADNTTGLALVIDPQRDIDIYLEEAKKANLTIKYVVLTHCHADFASGHLELAQNANATVCMGAKAEVKFPFQALLEGSLLKLGEDSYLKVLETPGHTPESICLTAYDTTLKADPVAVFTGDTLFLGDVGRPDLLVSQGLTAQDLAGMLFESINSKLKDLPDETIVYPAHGAGSSCGKNLSSDSSSTMAVQRLSNWALKENNKQAFINELVSCTQAPPKYFSYTASYNKLNHETLAETLKTELQPLSLAKCLELTPTHQILDVRDADTFSQTHIKGSINIGLSGKYANWCGSVLDPQKPLVIIAASGQEEEAAMRLGRIGFDNVVGFLKDSLSELSKYPELASSSVRLNSQELRLAVSTGTKTVLDVRTDAEYAGGHIEGSIHIPLSELADRVNEVPRDKELTVVCAGGYRSSIAASLLRKAGISNISDLIGGMGAYAKSTSQKAALKS